MAMDLSEEKREIIYNKRGCFVVRACPGSGKTLTVAARFARLLSERKLSHQGIAAISFTNVAWKEIQQFLEKEEGWIAKEFGKHTPISYPDFLGTIDSFINQYIFLPFGHLVMGCKDRPQFIGPPHNIFEPIENWKWWKNRECNHYQCKLNDFSYNEDGAVINFAPINRNHFEKCQTNPKICVKFKKQLSKNGWATQLDASYFALKILIDYPLIAKALAKRFPVLLIDEAQDSSTIQMMIIDILIENGLSEVMLVGDPDQAIYEWRTAKPELFNQKYQEWQMNSVVINENWRSTKSICAFADKISSLKKPMIARRGEDLIRWDRTPQILGYGSEKNLQNFVCQFIEQCENEEIEEDKVYVLSRSNNIWNDALPGSVPLPQKDLFPWKAKREEDRGIAHRIAKCKTLYDKKEFKEAFNQLEKALCALLKNIKLVRKLDLDEMIDEWGGFVKWRSDTFKFLKSLPKTDCFLAQWTCKANEVLGSISWLPDFRFNIISQGKYKYLYPNLTFEQLFVDPKAVNHGVKCSFGTVHSVKGETLEAVLFILRTKPHKSKLYPRLLDEETLSSNEELRVVYAAITRAAKKLALAVPKEHEKVWKRKFEV